jgi:hypothetical protein
VKRSLRLLNEPLIELAAVCLLMDLCHPQPDESGLGIVMERLVSDLATWHWSRTFARLESPFSQATLPAQDQASVPREEVEMLASVHRAVCQFDPYWRNQAQQLLATSSHPAIRTLTLRLLSALHG